MLISVSFLISSIFQRALVHQEGMAFVSLCNNTVKTITIATQCYWLWYQQNWQ